MTDRQKIILNHIIRTFILTAKPVSSRYLSKKTSLDLSDATIRNVMADLEDDGYIKQQHTSSGRVPTDKGYRLYVNLMMKVNKPLKKEQVKIDADIPSIGIGLYDDRTLKESSRILSKLSRQIGIVLTPKLAKGVFQKLSIIKVSSSRILIVVSVLDGFIKTVMIEVSSRFTSQELDNLSSSLNERLAGLTLEEIKSTFKKRTADYSRDSNLFRVFLNSTNEIFSDSQEDRLFVAGKENIFSNPEFEDRNRLKGIIELVEDQDIIVHLVENSNINVQKKDSVQIQIGMENQDNHLRHCSLVTAKYYAKSSEGLVGVIGPTRMDYEKMVRVIRYIANKLTYNFSSV